MKKFSALCLSVLLIGMIFSTPIIAAAEDDNIRVQGSAVRDETAEFLEKEIEATTYPIEVVASTYDYDASKDALYKHILQNNTGVTEEEALLLANELIEKTRRINESLTSASAHRGDGETSMEGIYYLGKIKDGELAEGTESLATFATGYDQIIPGDWVSEPTRTAHILSVRYTKVWYGFDSYKSSAGGKFTVQSELTASLQLGWSATGGLTKAVAEKFGISVTPTTNIVSKLSTGVEITAAPWTKTMMRPYIYFYADTYTGVRGYHCFNTATGEYFYETEEVYGQDKNLVEYGIRTWTRENSDKALDIASPVPPENWEW